MGGFVFRFGFFVIAGTYLWTYFGGFLLTTNEKSHICKDRYIFQSVIHVHFFFGGGVCCFKPFDKLQTLDDLTGPTLMTCCQWNLDVKSAWIVQAQPQSGLGICLEDYPIWAKQFYWINLGERELRRNCGLFSKMKSHLFESCNFLDFEWKVGPCCLLMNFQKAKLKVKTKGGDTNGSKVEVREGVGHKCGKFHGVSDNKHHRK